MKKWIQKYKDLKYRYKLTIMMILCSLIPVCVISGYTQIRTDTDYAGKGTNRIRAGAGAVREQY